MSNTNISLIKLSYVHNINFYMESINFQVTFYRNYILRDWYILKSEVNCRYWISITNIYLYLLRIFLYDLITIKLSKPSFPHWEKMYWCLIYLFVTILHDKIIKCGSRVFIQYIFIKTIGNVSSERACFHST